MRNVICKLEDERNAVMDDCKYCIKTTTVSFFYNTYSNQPAIMKSIHYNLQNVGRNMYGKSKFGQWDC